jgi:hypothetical protein
MPKPNKDAARFSLTDRGNSDHRHRAEGEDAADQCERVAERHRGGDGGLDAAFDQMRRPVQAHPSLHRIVTGDVPPTCQLATNPPSTL